MVVFKSVKYSDELGYYSYMMNSLHLYSSKLTVELDFLNFDVNEFHKIKIQLESNISTFEKGITLEVMKLILANSKFFITSFKNDLKLLQKVVDSFTVVGNLYYLKLLESEIVEMRKHLISYNNSFTLFERYIEDITNTVSLTHSEIFQNFLELKTTIKQYESEIKQVTEEISLLEERQTRLSSKKYELEEEKTLLEQTIVNDPLELSKKRSKIAYLEREIEEARVQNETGNATLTILTRNNDVKLNLFHEAFALQETLRHSLFLIN